MLTVLFKAPLDISAGSYILPPAPSQEMMHPSEHWFGVSEENRDIDDVKLARLAIGRSCSFLSIPLCLRSIIIGPLYPRRKGSYMPAGGACFSLTTHADSTTYMMQA